MLLNDCVVGRPVGVQSNRAAFGDEADVEIFALRGCTHAAVPGEFIVAPVAADPKGGDGEAEERGEEGGGGEEEAEEAEHERIVL